MERHEPSAKADWIPSQYATHDSYTLLASNSIKPGDQSWFNEENKLRSVMSIKVGVSFYNNKLHAK